MISRIIQFIALLASILGIVLAFHQKPELAVLTIAIFLLCLTAIYFYRNWPPFLKPRPLEPTGFMSKIDLSRVKAIRLLAHTGDNLYAAVHRRLDEIRYESPPRHKSRIEVQVVTRHPKAEGRQRAMAIESTRARVKNFQQDHFNIQLRFYQDLPAHRGVIIEYTDGKRISYVSAYYWPTFKSRSLPQAMVIMDSCDQPHILVTMLESWIKHYWGTGKIHTIVFDFDDTLADTMDIQVEAWMEAIDSALQIGIILESQLSAEVRKARSNHDKYHKCIKDIFIELQMSEQIVAAILPDIAASVKERIDSDRFDIRQKKLLEKGELFPGVREKLGSLRDHYQLVIVTATSSVLVSKFLDKRGVADCFSIILGKDDPKHQWENVHSKAIFLIEVSGLAGIPLDRLVFVGDNTADYEAASQMGVTFIEAAHTAERVGKRSLIKGLLNISRKPPKRFSGFSDDSFDKILAQLNQEDL